MLCKTAARKRELCLAYKWQVKQMVLKWKILFMLSYYYAKRHSELLFQVSRTTDFGVKSHISWIRQDREKVQKKKSMVITNKLDMLKAQACLDYAD